MRFEQDDERSLSPFSGECSIHGDGGAFARVKLAPAIMPSISMYVRSFDGTISPVPALGAEAVFVDVSLPPHVVFPIWQLIIDVDAENVQTPSRETMLALAKRVREPLTGANS